MHFTVLTHMVRFTATLLVAGIVAAVTQGMAGDAWTQDAGVLDATVMLQLSQTPCVEAVVLDPRRLQSIAMALESAVYTPVADNPERHFDVYTIGHGDSNGEYVRQLVENNPTLREQRDLGTLRFQRFDLDD